MRFVALAARPALMASLPNGIPRAFAASAYLLGIIASRVLPGVNCTLDTPHALLQRLKDFVFPKPDHKPPSRTQRRCLTLVAGNVVFDFLLPPRGVSFRHAKVARTPVPETTVNKHTHTHTPKDNVGLTSHVGFRSDALPVSQPTTEECRSKENLRCCVFAAY